MLIQDFIRQIKNELAKNSDTAHIDTEVIFCHVLHLSKTELYLAGKNELKPEQLQAIQLLVARRRAGEPIAYLIGHKEFWSLPLQVTKDTLIPRPETELLVELTLAKLPKNEACQVLDMGTGTGAIALALAHERPNWQIVATDINEDTLSVAMANAKNLGLSNVKFLASDWFNNLTGLQFDGIVANPPYIAASDEHLQLGDLRFEPKQALVAPEHGLGFLRHIISHAQTYLKDTGWLLVEYGYNQVAEVDALFKAAQFNQIQNHQDLAGIGRATSGQK